MDAVAASRRPSAPPLAYAINSIAVKNNSLAAAHATRAVPVRAVIGRVVVVDLVRVRVRVGVGVRVRGVWWWYT